MGIGVIGTVTDNKKDFKEMWQSAVARGTFEGSFTEYVKESIFPRYTVTFTETLKHGSLRADGARISDEFLQQADLQAGDKVAVEIDLDSNIAQVINVIKLG